MGPHLYGLGVQKDSRKVNREPASGRYSKLRADLDQLWAEAAAREAAGESIRLDPALWEAAGEQQEQRRIEDPFVQHLEEALGDREGVLPCAHVWRLLGVDIDRLSP